MTTINMGVVHGRFQPFHLDHLTYALEALKRCKYLFIGITNPDPQDMIFQESDPNRSRDVSNPFTFWERSLIIQATMKGAGVSQDRFTVVPFPINRVELLKYYVPLDARFYMTIYDDWGRHKRDLLIAQGLDVEIMWERESPQKQITATEVRQRMAMGDSWQSLIPEEGRNVIKELALDKRVKEIYEKRSS